MSRRARCPGCDRRRVLYDAGIELPVCRDCGQLVSMYRAYVHVGILVELLKDPDTVARIEALSDSFSALIKLALDK